jgi:hypothetical protein
VPPGRLTLLRLPGTVVKLRDRAASRHAEGDFHTLFERAARFEALTAAEGADNARVSRWRCCGEALVGWSEDVRHQGEEAF